MSLPKIAVIGAGPAGLVVARLLQVSGIPCIVYEYEADRHARTQGGSLDLHEGAAQVALKEAGLYDQFLTVARPEGEVLKIYEPDGNILLDESAGYGERRPDSFKGRPEVDRIQLRNMLIDSLAEGSLKWGHKLKAVHTDASGTSLTYELHFEDRVETGFDLVIGADGAWSKVRAIISDTRPQYSGISGVDVRLDDIDNVDPHLAKRVGLGMCLTLGSNITVLSQRNGDGCVRTYGFMRGLAEDWPKTCGIDWSQPETAKKEFIERYYDGFNDDSKNLIFKAHEIDPRPMYMLPIGHRWLHRQGVTLIGDAAHLMTPFAGVGVNVAMEDGLELAHAIISAKSNWTTESFIDSNGLSAAVRKYEEAMFTRAEAYAKETWMYFNLFFHEKGGQPMCDHFKQAKELERAAAAEKAEKEATVTAEPATATPLESLQSEPIKIPFMT